MEIKNVGSGTEKIHEKKGKKDKPVPVGAAGEAGFAREVDAVVLEEREARKKDLQGLMQDIDEGGKHLLRHPGKEEAARFKMLVKVFLDRVLHDGYEVRGSRASEKSGRKSIYSVVVQVDHALAELTEAVLRSQQPALNLAGKIDEIKGLLTDLIA